MPSHPAADLDGRVALVTGASSGLGARFARVLADHGARVVVAARRADRVQALADEIGAERALAVPTDVTEERAVAALVDAAVTRFGRLDIMVNNAGYARTRPAERESVERFRRHLEINLVAVFTGCREAARVMLPQGSGSIVNVASMVGLVSVSPWMPMAGYAASKGGVVQLTRELAVQWAPRGVRVNALAPGYFPTEMTGMLEDDEQVRWIERMTPLGRPGRVEELDGPLLLLAGDAGSYITGHTLVVDGGWTVA